jgi:hypothetical protein
VSRARPAQVAATFLSAAVALAGARAARAEVVAEIGPAVGVGWTDNASQVTDVGQKAQPDEFTTVIGTARGRYVGQKTEQGIGYRLTLTKYFNQRSSDTVSQEVVYFSTYNLTPTLDLLLGAAGTYTKTSAFILSDQSATTQQAIGGAYMKYISGTVNQGLAYQPNARRRYIEGLSLTRLRYLEVSQPGQGVAERAVPPDTTYVNVHLRSEWERARDGFSADFSFTDSYSDNPRLRATIGPHRLFAQLLGGYHREFNTVWSGDIAAGGVLVLTTDLAGIAAPAGFANVSYRRLFWFASASVAQSAAPNIFIGNATINDQAVVRAALPLNRSELLVLSGNASYTYARFAYQDHQSKAYSLISTGASLTWHAERIPIWATLDYSYMNQSGSMSYESGFIPSRVRNVVMLTVGGSFVFGKGTPPIITGSLMSPSSSSSSPSSSSSSSSSK